MVSGEKICQKTTNQNGTKVVGVTTVTWYLREDESDVVLWISRRVEKVSSTSHGDVILKVVPDAGGVDYGLNPSLLQERGRSNSRQHEELRSLDRSSAQYHLSGSDDCLLGAVLFHHNAVSLRQSRKKHDQGD